MGSNWFTFNSMLITAGGRYFAGVESVSDEKRLFACKSVTCTKLWSLVTGQHGRGVLVVLCDKDTAFRL